MSFELLDEHEQGELVRKWLRENAMSIVVGVGLGLVLIFGWQQWKARGVRHAAEASAQYHALADAVTARHDEDAGKIAEALRADYPNSVYAVLAALRRRMPPAPRATSPMRRARSIGPTSMRTYPA